ncbi:MAG: transposase [Candidatus Ozemobacteraceae bacterium]
MAEYKQGSHTVWDCKYHLVWTTKYRYPVVVGGVLIRFSENIFKKIIQALVYDPEFAC